ncbi:MAG: nitroreductase family protein [Lentisphaeria bacterium]|nr:nitroreductase family protein [Lentisphaeria bacterium]
MIRIDAEKCVRCHACIRDCVVAILQPGADGVPVLAPELERFCLNCQHCLAVCPAEAVVSNGVSAVDCPPAGALPEPEKMGNLIRQRRSIRHYKDENIDPEAMKMLLDHLAWSPTGCNDHSLYFAVVQDKAEMVFFRETVGKMLNFLIRWKILQLLYPNVRRFLEEIRNGEDVIFRRAPHMIVAAVPGKAPCKYADPWIALTQFDLLAQSLGIGTCWCGFAVYALRWSRKMRDRLQIPAGYKIGGVLLFGKADVSYRRGTRPAPFPGQNGKTL